MALPKEKQRRLNLVDLQYPSRALNEKPLQRTNVAARGMPPKLKAEVLNRDDFTCQMCGLTLGETDPETGRTIRVRVGNILHESLGGKHELSNLRALCLRCYRGAKSITSARPSAIWLLSQIRRAGLDEQRAVFERLRTKFGAR